MDNDPMDLFYRTKATHTRLMNIYNNLVTDASDTFMKYKDGVMYHPEGAKKSWTIFFDDLRTLGESLQQMNRDTGEIIMMIGKLIGEINDQP